MPTPPAGGGVHVMGLWCASVATLPLDRQARPSPAKSAMRRQPPAAFPARASSGAVRETELRDSAATGWRFARREEVAKKQRERTWGNRDLISLSAQKSNNAYGDGDPVGGVVLHEQVTSGSITANWGDCARPSMN